MIWASTFITANLRANCVTVAIADLLALIFTFRWASSGAHTQRVSAFLEPRRTAPNRAAKKEYRTQSKQPYDGIGGTSDNT